MKFEKKIIIGEKIISAINPTYIIAEIGVNHNGNIESAKKMVKVAHECGVDAVKFQSFKTDNLILQNISKAPYQKMTTEKNESQYDMLKKLEVSLTEMKEIKEYCRSIPIMFLSTPFDDESLEELESISVEAYKIASTDITNIPFLRKVAKKGKPIFLSTGMSYLSEVQKALEEIYIYNKQVVLFQCTANYPIKEEEANLNILNLYQKKFDVLLGYSDHSEGVGASPYAVAMGARVIEKHFTLDKTASGPDHKASINPQEMKMLVKKIRQVESYMGSNIKEPTSSEYMTRKSLQKYLVAARPIMIGEKFTEDNVTYKRTGGEGISVFQYDSVLQREATKDYQQNEIIIE